MGQKSEISPFLFFFPFLFWYIFDNLCQPGANMVMVLFYLLSLIVQVHDNWSILIIYITPTGSILGKAHTNDSTYCTIHCNTRIWTGSKIHGSYSWFQNIRPPMKNYTHCRFWILMISYPFSDIWSYPRGPAVSASMISIEKPSGDQKINPTMCVIF